MNAKQVLDVVCATALVPHREKPALIDGWPVKGVTKFPLAEAKAVQ